MSEPIIAEISLNKLYSNALNVKGLLNKGVKFCAVVKSNAYGHGITEVALKLYPICDSYAVSLASEAVALRFSGIDKPIILLTPITENTVDSMVLKGITMTVNSLKELELINKTSIKYKTKSLIHLAVNSGMNRLGIDTCSDIDKCIEYIAKNKYLILDGAMSHFGCVEDKNYTKSSFNNFIKLTKNIKKYNKNANLHISASGGLLSENCYQLSMVRIGILLYGYKPFESNVIDVEPIMKIKARKLLVKEGVLGKRLLYGGEISKENSISILRLGYADGFNRTFNSDYASNLCMDISALNGKAEEDYVVVMENAELTAKKWGTISYDVLTSTTTRAQRIYVE